MEEEPEHPTAPGAKHARSADAGGKRRDDDSRDLVGEVIGHIRIVDVLGTGGMGTVYLGKDEKLDRRVAVKAIRHDRTDDETRARFLREAQILSRLNHPNICQIHDIMENEGSDLLILELVEGRTLRRLLAGSIDRELAMDIAEQLASVLVVAHAQGIIHRDLKPENVMLTAERTVKVLDFGLARSLHSDLRSTIVLGESSFPPGKTPSQAGYTTIGAVMGTIGYMSPEQARGEAATAASDLHSLGLLLQEIFTGRPPYDRSLSAEELLQHTADGKSEPVDGLSRSLTRLLEDLKAPAREDRPAATEVVKRLRRLRTAPARRLRRFAAAGAAAALVLLGVKYTVDLSRERRAAVAARAQLEELMDFMVDDIHDGLEPLGRLDLLETVADRALDYYSLASGEAELADDAALRRTQALRNLGSVLHMKGDSEAALSSLERARSLAADRLVDTPDDSAWLLQAAETEYRIGFVRQRRGEIDASIEAFAGVEQIIGDLPEEVRRHFDWQELLAATRSKTAVALSYRGDFDEALSRYEQARAIQEALVSLDPEDHVGRQHLGTIYDGMAIVSASRGQAEEAVPLFLQAEASFAAAAVMAPGDLRPRYGLASSKGRRGEVQHHLGELRAARGAFEEALEIVEFLVATDPADSRFKQELAVSCARLSEVLLDLDQTDEALTSLRRAISIEEALVSTDPDNLEWANNLAYDLVQLGVLHQEAGNEGAAHDAWQRAVSGFAPLIDDDSPLAVLDTYATGLIHLGRYDEARVMVRRLVDAGWQNHGLLELAGQHGLLDR